MSHFTTTRKGIVAHFSDVEKEFLSDVVPFLAGIGEEDDDPASTRLNVPVYLDNPESNQEWWRLMGPELGASRTADRELFSRVVGTDGYVMRDGEADAFLRVINEARLALGARMGLEIEEDHDLIPEEVRWPLDYLGWLQEELTAELSRHL